MSMIVWTLIIGAVFFGGMAAGIARIAYADSQSAGRR